MHGIAYPTIAEAFKEKFGVQVYNEKKVKYVVEHYGLDPKYGYVPASFFLLNPCFRTLLISPTLTLFWTTFLPPFTGSTHERRRLATTNLSDIPGASYTTPLAPLGREGHVPVAGPGPAGSSRRGRERMKRPLRSPLLARLPRIQSRKCHRATTRHTATLAAGSGSHLPCRHSQLMGSNATCEGPCRVFLQFPTSARSPQSPPLRLLRRLPPILLGVPPVYATMARAMLPVLPSQAVITRPTTGPPVWMLVLILVR